MCENCEKTDTLSLFASYRVPCRRMCPSLRYICSWFECIRSWSNNDFTGHIYKESEIHSEVHAKRYSICMTLRPSRTVHHFYVHPEMVYGNLGIFFSEQTASHKYNLTVKNFKQNKRCKYQISFLRRFLMIFIYFIEW